MKHHLSTYTSFEMIGSDGYPTGECAEIQTQYKFKTRIELFNFINIHMDSICEFTRYEIETEE